MIRLSFTGARAEIRLDRPAARNALDRAGWHRLAEAIAEVERSQARVLILGSAVEGAFCAGSDLAEIGALAADAEARAPFRSLMRVALDALPALPIPTIAAIDGDCFGAGVALALACDLRVAGRRARFAITPAKLGISYPKEDVARLVSAVGHGQAARLLFTAEAVPADEAVRIGLAEEAAAIAQTRAAALADAIAANSGVSLAALKAMLAERATRAESDSSFDACFGGEEFAERLAAFHGRRRRHGGEED